MTTFGQAVLLQTAYYAIVMLFGVLAIGAVQRGFFINYFRVRLSFGRFVMVKIRSPLRDYFAVGWVEEGFLMYKHKAKSTGTTETIRLNIPKKSTPFYRAMSVAWVDVDDEKHAIAMIDYSTVAGYDAVKNSSLHTRALMKPAIASGMEKIIIALVVVAILISLGSIYMGYVSYNEARALHQALPGMLEGLKGTVIGGSGI